MVSKLVRLETLRILWTIAVGMLAVLLCVLWVRSYSYADMLEQGRKTITSHNGRLFLNASFPASANIAVERGRYDDLFGRSFVWVGFNPTDIAPTGTDHLVHYSSLAAIAGLVAAVPWLPWSKRFSLRTLLLAMTLVAVVLGLFYMTRVVPPR